MAPSAPPSSILSDPPSSIPSDPPSSVPPSSAEPSPPTPTPSDPTDPPEHPVIFTRGSFSCGGGFYISRAMNTFGEYALTTDPAMSLVLDIDMVAAQLGPVSMTTVNGSPTFPQLSALNGFANVNADLGPGTYKRSVGQSLRRSNHQADSLMVQPWIARQPLLTDNFANSLEFQLGRDKTIAPALKTKNDTKLYTPSIIDTQILCTAATAHPQQASQPA